MVPHGRRLAGEESLRRWSELARAVLQYIFFTERQQVDCETAAAWFKTCSNDKQVLATLMTWTQKLHPAVSRPRAHLK
uniref:Uncharacterized protein n=1 Tax=Setaria italica TaxID=4555 RepID=K3XNX3_SETIT